MFISHNFWFGRINHFSGSLVAHNLIPNSEKAFPNHKLITKENFVRLKNKLIF